MKIPILLVVLCKAADGCNGVGRHNSLALGRDNLALISYEDDLNQNLKVAHCEDAACTTATISSLEDEGVLGSHTSIAIGSDGLGLIAYSAENRLKVAHCENVPCTRASLSAIEGANGARHISVAVGPDGLPLIVYQSNWTGDIVAVHCEDVACTVAGATTLVDAARAVGSAAAMAMGSDGRGLIVYYQDGFGLRVAHCNDTACTGASFLTLEEHFVQEVSVTIGSDGLGLIVYPDQGLKVARCRDLSCSVVDTVRLTSDWSAGTAAVTVGSDGLPIIAVSNFGLTIGHCEDLACRDVTPSAIEGAECEFFLSAGIGADGLPLVSCWADSANLQVAHCQDPLCASAGVTTLDRGA